VVLFTSAIVVGALLLLGAALHALLAKSLYSQQSNEAIQEVQVLTRRASDAATSSSRPGGAEAQQELIRELTSGASGGQPSFEAVVLRDSDGGSIPSNQNFRVEQVPQALVDRVLARSELAFVYIDSPVRPGRMLVVGAPIRTAQGGQEAYFFYPLKFQ
jgi:hypothetical protein